MSLPENAGSQRIGLERIGRVSNESLFSVSLSILTGDPNGDIATDPTIAFGPMVRTQSLNLTVPLDDWIESDEVYQLTIGAPEGTLDATTAEITILDQNGRPGAFRIVPELSDRKELTRAVGNSQGHVLIFGFSQEPVIIFDSNTRKATNVHVISDDRTYVSAAVPHADGFLIAVSPRQIAPGNVGQIRRINSAGVSDPSFQSPPLNISPRNIFIEPDGTLVVGGTALWQTNLPTYHAARLNADGSIKETFRLVEKYHIGALLPAGKLVYKSHYSIRAFDLDTHEASRSFKTINVATDSIEQIIASGDQFYVSGWFHEIHGFPITNLARINSDGTLDKTFAPVMNLNNITSISLDAQGRVLIFGVFESANGIPRRYATRLNRDGSTDPSFDPGLSLVSEGWLGLVRSIVPLPNGEMFATINFPNASKPWQAAIVTQDLPFKGELVRQGGELEYRLLTVPQAFYQIESSPDLKTWSELRTTNSPGYQLRIPVGDANARQFIRARTN